MPTELRRIILTESELHDATRSFLRSSARVQDVEALVSITPAKDFGLTISCRRPGGDEFEIQLCRAEVLRLLVQFCLELNIPLPRKARKMPAIQGQSLTLQIDIPGEASFVE